MSWTAILCVLVFVIKFCCLSDAAPAHCQFLYVNRIYVQQQTSASNEFVLIRPLPEGSGKHGGVDLYIGSSSSLNSESKWCRVTDPLNTKEFFLRGSFSSPDKDRFYLSLWNYHHVHPIVDLFINNNSVLTYSCDNMGGLERTPCFHLTINYISNSNQRLNKRSLSMDDPSHAHAWKFPFVGGVLAIMGVVLLTLLIVLCMGKSQPEVQSKDIGKIHVLSGPPPEYFNPPPPASVSVSVNHRSSTPPRGSSSPASKGNSLPSKGSSLPRDIQPSPSIKNSASKELRSMSLSPDHMDHHRRKLDTPLPDIPTANDHSNVKKDGSLKRNESPLQLPGMMLNRLESNDTSSIRTGGSDNYFEVKDIDRRGRSSTDPVEPGLPSPVSPIPRSYTEKVSHDQLPLPLPPRNYKEEEERMYDSIEDLRRGNKKQENTNDDLEDEGNEMYESVPEDFREELRSISSPVIPPTVPPVPMQHTETTPSPTKALPTIATSSAPDSPNRRRLIVIKDRSSKKKNRPESVSGTPDPSAEDGKHRMSFFNRLRASSASSNIGATKKDESSPHHLPLPPQPVEDYDDDDDDTYDSVQDMAARGLSTFGSRINQPLPDVPEDSGSGSTASVVKHKRELDVGDPNYDTVTSTMRGRHESSNEVRNSREPDYDEVRQKSAESGQQQLHHHPPSHNYAKVVSHSSHTSQQEVSHNQMEYAVIDSSVVEKKRARGSVPHPHIDVDITQTNEEEEEDPYDRINLDDEEEDPYSRIKNEEDPYDQVNIEPSNDDAKEVEDPYTKIANVDNEVGDQVEQTEPSNTSSEEKPREKDEASVTIDESEEHPVDSTVAGDSTVAVDSTVAIDSTVADNNTVCTDETYATIDPGVIQWKRSMSVNKTSRDKHSANEDVNKNVTELEVVGGSDDILSSTSSVPCVPLVGDLGDISEFIPPPVPPQQLLDLSENESSSDNDENLAEQEHVSAVVNEPSAVQNPLLRNSVQSSTSSDGVPVCDSLDSQQPMYDSLEPQDTNIYDSLLPKTDDNNGVEIST